MSPLLCKGASECYDSFIDGYGCNGDAAEFERSSRHMVFLIGPSLAHLKMSLSRFPGHVQSAGEYPVTKCHGKTRSTDVHRGVQVWRKKYASTEVRSEKSVSSESVEAELRRLRRENAALKEDREILKKAAAFLAKGFR